MYFVDRALLEKRLIYVEGQLRFLAGRTGADTELERLAVERAVHMCIEALLDIGNQMIDGFIMRDPGSYEDILLILGDEQVLPEHEMHELVRFIALRKHLVTEYTEIEFANLWAVYQQAKTSLEAFPGRVRDYLHNESGPVSAFLPHNEE